MGLEVRMKVHNKGFGASWEAIPLVGNCGKTVPCEFIQTWLPLSFDFDISWTFLTLSSRFLFVPAPLTECYITRSSSHQNPDRIL